MAKNNYVSPSLTGYNANPPVDDGTETEANRVKWDTVKVKIGDPLNTFSSAIDSAIDSALDKLPNNSTTAQATNFNVATGDDGKIFLVTGNSTASLPAAATVGAGFQVTIKKNEAGNTVTIDADGSDTIDGQATRTLTEPFLGETLVSDGSSNWTIASHAERDTPLPTDFFNGFELTNNGTDSEHDINFAAGSCRDDSDTGNIVLSSTIVKQIDSVFAEGTGAGGLDTGVVAADTTYHVWIIGKASDGTSDGLFSLSDTAPTLPTGFDLQRRVGQIITDSSNNIVNNWFSQVIPNGELFTADVATTSGTSVTLASDLPSGINKVKLYAQGVSQNSANQVGLIQIGDLGGFETTGYNSAAGFISGTSVSIDAATAGFAFSENTNFDAATAVSNKLVMELIDPDTNTWSFSCHLVVDSGSQIFVGNATKSLSGELTQIRLTTTGGTATYDAGSIITKAEITKGL